MGFLAQNADKGHNEQVGYLRWAPDGTRTSRAGRVARLLLVGALLAGAPGCGNDSAEEDEAEVVATAVAVPHGSDDQGTHAAVQANPADTDDADGSAPETTAAEADDDAADTASPGAETPTPGQGGAGGSVTSCADLAGAWVAVSEGLATVDTELPREVVNGFRQAGQALEGVNPPSGIATEWTNFASYITEVNQAFGPVDPSDLEAVRTAFNSVEGADGAADSAEAITAFLNADCQG